MNRNRFHKFAALRGALLAAALGVALGWLPAWSLG